MSFFAKIFKYNEKSTQIQGLNDSLKALYVYDYFNHDKDSILVVTNTLFEANKFYQEIYSYTKDVLLFPMDDFLTSEALAISPDLKNTRLETLNEILNTKKIVVTNLMGYLRFLPPKEIYLFNKIVINKNKEYNKESLEKKLVNMGYTRETLVDKTGVFASRGYVLDIFPISSTNPIRIEFFGDEIESIKEFNVDNQLTIKPIESIEIYPNTEFLIDDENMELTETSQKNLVKYLTPTNIYNFIKPSFVFFDNYSEIKSANESLMKEINDYNVSQNIASSTMYMNDFYSINPNMYKDFITFDNVNLDTPELAERYICGDIENFTGSISDIKSRLNSYIKSNKTVLICLGDRYKIDKFLLEFDQENIIFTDENNIVENKINLIIKSIKTGFEYNKYICISENELYNKKTSDFKYKSNFKLGTKIRDINKLNVGDYIVHYSHGIGRYIGIKTLVKNGFKKDYLELEYKDSDKLYIPVEKIELISKYSTNEGIVPKINKLGSKEWQKTKLRVKQKIESIAADLLKLYAEREASKGIKFDKDNENQIEFEKCFPYDETPDQLRVTEEIKKDMESSKVMDRLLCGDVGYGKTEVAFRAAYKAIISGYQVAFLCPTTILSNQHFQNALNRFSSFAVNIKLLNRFTSLKDVENIKIGLEKGNIDLLIGTHRILSKDINFKNLGLLIIDEEQRFGVKAKEQIKEYKNNIDVLTLSATPIPRTLQMSMSGIRSLSLLETPPVDRYPIQTYVIAENKQIIKESIYKELSRNGQVFILYNNIEDMEEKKLEIQNTVPDAKIVCAHGRLSKTELENIMISFVNKEFDILLCTTIIETGIDIPNANTLIILDADKFGLSQLYQIRGRVGRSNKIAYCYLMYDKHKILSEIATKRLKVIKEFTELGSGFSIAVRDLSIRGAGDILGSEQAGFIDSVGVELFLNMLNEEISKQQNKEVSKDLKREELISEVPLLDVSTSIDDKYVSEVPLKIEIHKMINSIDSLDNLEKIKLQIEDRFGTVSDDIIIYMYEELFEKKARKLGITKINQTKNFVEVILPPLLTQKIDGEKLFMEANSITRMFRFSMKNRSLSIILDIVKLENHYIYYLIKLCDVINESIKK